MSTIKYVCGIISFLCFAQRLNVDGAVRSFKQYHNHPEKEVFYDDYSFKDGNLVYLVCDGTEKEKKCNVMQEKYPDGKLLHSCNVTLETYQENAKLTDKIYIVTFGHNHAILFWDEIGLNTVHFKLLTIELDKCLYGGFALVDPSKKIYNQLRFDDKIVTNDDSFEIFMKNGNLTNGDNDTEQIMTVNSRGFVDKGPTDFLKTGNYSISHISPIDINSSNNKSYVYFKERLEEYLLVILKSDGTEKVLATKNNKFNFYSSLVNDLISLCERERLHSIMTCTQYDKEGNVKFNITFDDDNFKQNVAPRNMYNLPDGGFLIALSEYAKSGNEVDYSTVIDYVIMKVNSEGKKVGNIHLKGLVDADNLIKDLIVDVRIWKNENEEYCAGVIGQGVNQTNFDDKLSDLSIVVDCFKEANLIT